MIFFNLKWLSLKKMEVIYNKKGLLESFVQRRSYQGQEKMMQTTINEVVKDRNVVINYLCCMIMLKICLLTQCRAPTSRKSWSLVGTLGGYASPLYNKGRVTYLHNEVEIDKMDLDMLHIDE